MEFIAADHVVVTFSVERLFVTVTGAFKTTWTFDKQKQGRVKQTACVLFFSCTCEVIQIHFCTSHHLIIFIT